MRKLILGAVAAAAIASPLALASAANAYTADSAGFGFIGKGEVQTALGMNNAALQKAVDARSLLFTAQVPTTQSLDQSVSQTGLQYGVQMGVQSASQTGAQSATQVVSQDLTCIFTNGSGTKTFHRDGVRDGERTGTREGIRTSTREVARIGARNGERTGTQSGVQSGALAYDIAVDARKGPSQYTGFNVKGFKGTSAYSEVGAPQWNAPSFGDWSPSGNWSYYTGWLNTGDFTFGDYSFRDYSFEDVSGTEWGDWDAAPGENPDDCLRSENADKITQISNVVTPGAITDGAITDGAIIERDVTLGDVIPGEFSVTGTSYGPSTPGAVVAGTPVKMFVNGKAL